MSISVAIPAQATTPTVSPPPTLSIDQATGEITINSPVWSDSAAGGSQIRACPSQISAQSTATTSTTNAVSQCATLFVASGSVVPATNLNSAYISVPPPLEQSQNGNYTDFASSYPFIVHRFSTTATPNFVWSASVEWLGGGSSTEDVVSTPPYTGPVLQAPGATKPVAAGGKLTIPGSNLSGVSSVEIGGQASLVVVNSDSELEVVIPAGLAPGKYDIIVVSDSGRLTVQDGLTISAGAATTPSGDLKPSTRLKEDNTVKVYLFNVIGNGKVQIFLNGKEIAWINPKDSTDPKLKDDYFVRTLKLDDGKNIITVVRDGVQVSRKAYTASTS
jgi:hypothetical protein